VEQMAVSNNILYLVGPIGSVGHFTGMGAVIDSAGKVVENFPKIVDLSWPENFFIETAISDEEGGFFIFGEFDTVGGLARDRFVHILADGSIDPDFDAGEVGGDISAMAVYDSTLYLGGNFSEIGGEDRENIASFNVETKELTGWNPGVDGTVKALAVSTDGILYIGGDFSEIEGEGRSNIASYNMETEELTVWRPEVNDAVYDIAVSPTTDIVYITGSFTQVGAVNRQCLASFYSNDSLTEWDYPEFSGSYWYSHPTLLNLRNETLFVAGDITQVGTEPRDMLAALNANTGDLLEFAPEFDADGWPFIGAIHTTNDKLYVGGEFEEVDGNPQKNIVSFNLTNLSWVDDWNPRPNAPVQAISSGDLGVFVGGDMGFFGYEARGGGAGINLTTNEITEWDPGLDSEGYGRRITADTDGRIYVTVNGQIMAYDHQGDPLTGFTPPEIDGEIYSLAVNGNTLYVGGDFTINDKDLNNIVALDSLTGEIIPNWDEINADGSVLAITVVDDTVYVGGEFEEIMGKEQNYLAALDLEGQVINWQPNPDDSVHSLLGADSKLYLGGKFREILDEERNLLASIDLPERTLSDWVPNIPQEEQYTD